MDRHGHVMTDTEDGAEGVRTRTEMCYRAQELHTQSFLLQRIFLGVGRSVYL